MSSLVQAFSDIVARFADRPAVIEPDGETLDYAALDLHSNRIACALIDTGIEPDDRVGLYCINSAAFVAAYWGILKAGATVVPLNLLQPPTALAYILEDSGARAVLFHATLAERVAAIRSDAPSVGHFAEIGALLSDATAVASPVDQPVADPAQRLAALLYTSGTTGHPKGAMLSHANLLANVSSVHRAMQWRFGEDIVLVVLPMFHAFAATVGTLAPLLCGSALVPLPRFDPELVADTIAATRASLFLGVPSMYTVLLRLKPERAAQFRLLRYCVSGGAALPVDILRRFEERFGVPVYEGDGPTECSPVTCLNPVGGLAKPGTVGLPIPDVEMRIVDDDDRPLPPNEVGEIAVRGPNVMQGYWNQPEATAESFRDGWFLTGDLGTVDEDGYFSIVDRKKDLIIVNGMNVYPRVIEELLYRQPGVREVAVVGEPNDLHGEIPVAYVVVDDGNAPTEADLRTLCRSKLARHEVPRSFVFLDKLPRNAAGKVLKRELRTHGEVERGIVGLKDPQ